MSHTVLLVRVSDIVGSVLHFAGSIGHSHAQSGKGDHTLVIVTIATGNNFFTVDI